MRCWERVLIRQCWRRMEEEEEEEEIARYRVCCQGENTKGNCGAFAINKVKKWGVVRGDEVAFSDVERRKQGRHKGN